MSHKDKLPKTPAPTAAKVQFDLKAALSEQLESAVGAAKEALEAQVKEIDEKIESISGTFEKFSELLKPSPPAPKDPGSLLAKAQFELMALVSAKLEALSGGDNSFSLPSLDDLPDLPSLNGLPDLPSLNGLPDLPTVNTDAIKEELEAQVKAVDEKIKSLTEAVEKGKKLIHFLT